MKRSLKIFLILTSCIFLASCCPTLKTIQKKDKAFVIPVSSPVQYTDSTAIYRAKINAFDNYFSGLIYFKKTDSITDRIIFLSELGLTLMSLKMDNEDFAVNYCPDQLNKKILIKQLEKDFRLLLLKYPEFNSSKYLGVLKKKKSGKIKIKKACLKFHFSEENELLKYHQKKILSPKSVIKIDKNDITISHKIPKFTIELTKIQK